ncbi:unnamed protein product [Sphagnum jensenii]|uniref:MADS-box transcription factor n=1 Tax=Sphagnum jensenii TaxID=128206 RepID=A0ABP1AJW6_9BRYO
MLKLPQLQLQRGNKRWRNKNKYLEKSNERRYVDSGISTSFVCELRALTSSNDPLPQRIIASEVREKGNALRESCLASQMHGYDERFGYSLEVENGRTQQPPQTALQGSGLEAGARSKDVNRRSLEVGITQTLMRMSSL